MVCLKGSATISIHEERLQSQTNQFEIVFKSLARSSSQYRVKESFKLLFAIQVEEIWRYKLRNSLATKNFKF